MQRYMRVPILLHMCPNNATCVFILLCICVAGCFQPFILHVLILLHVSCYYTQGPSLRTIGVCIVCIYSIYTHYTYTCYYIQGPSLRSIGVCIVCVYSIYTHYTYTCYYIQGPSLRSIYIHLWVQYIGVSYYMCPRTLILLSSCYCILKLRLPIGAIHRCILLYVSSYYYAICARILLRTCLAAFFSPSILYLSPNTTIDASAYCSICVRILLRICVRILLRTCLAAFFSPSILLYVSSHCYAIYVSSCSRDVLAAHLEWQRGKKECA